MLHVNKASYKSGKKSFMCIHIYLISKMYIPTSNLYELFMFSSTDVGLTAGTRLSPRLHNMDAAVE